VTGRAIPDDEQALVDLVKADYEATHRALAGFSTSGGQLRSIGIAAWGVVFAAALAAQASVIAWIAVGLPAAFAVADGYYTELERQALVRSRKLETLLRDYHRAIGLHGHSARRVARAVGALEQHKFGVHRAIRSVNEHRLWWLPRPVRVTWIYPVLMSVALVTAIVLRGGANVDCVNGEVGSKPCVVLTTPEPVRTTTVTRTVTIPPLTRTPGKGSSASTSAP
jgi:hypothetical protein